MCRVVTRLRVGKEGPTCQSRQRRRETGGVLQDTDGRRSRELGWDANNIAALSSSQPLYPPPPPLCTHRHTHTHTYTHTFGHRHPRKGTFPYSEVIWAAHSGALVFSASLNSLYCFSGACPAPVPVAQADPSYYYWLPPFPAHKSGKKKIMKCRLGEINMCRVQKHKRDVQKCDLIYESRQSPVGSSCLHINQRMINQHGLGCPQFHHWLTNCGPE